MRLKDKFKLLKILFITSIVVTFLWAENSFSTQETKPLKSQIENCNNSNLTAQFFLIEPNINEESETHSSSSDQFISLYYKENFNHKQPIIKQRTNYSNFTMGNALFIYSLGSRSPPLS
ncbi:MAG: hypothetical protein GW938_14495 [Leptospira sp.]|nr:hypothetical protein [Leptospira sp.]